VSDQRALEQDNLSPSGSLSVAGGEAESSAFIYAARADQLRPARRCAGGAGRKHERLSHASHDCEHPYALLTWMCDFTSGADRNGPEVVPRRGVG